VDLPYDAMRRDLADPFIDTCPALQDALAALPLIDLSADVLTSMQKYWHWSEAKERVLHTRCGG
jgi:hypothetical protein